MKATSYLTFIIQFHLWKTSIVGESRWIIYDDYSKRESSRYLKTTVVDPWFLFCFFSWLLSVIAQFPGSLFYGFIIMSVDKSKSHGQALLNQMYLPLSEDLGMWSLKNWKNVPVKFAYLAINAEWIFFCTCFAVFL